MSFLFDLVYIIVNLNIIVPTQLIGLVRRYLSINYHDVIEINDVFNFMINITDINSLYLLMIHKNPIHPFSLLYSAVISLSHPFDRLIK